MSVKPRVAIASKSECLVRGAEVGVEFEVCFLFWFFRRLLFVPVHVVKRKARLKPATTAQFF
ncbi:MAG: hypothetical protein AUH19_04615 [Verrucomicrobia bacterium 13_2_20CM_55_10]|nr:MAG: hypothetical protein AUH19_04615 [Verrucomicrobia bacterium 13_2_20CM_55_10]